MRQQPEVRANPHQEHPQQQQHPARPSYEEKSIRKADSRNIPTLLTFDKEMEVRLPDIRRGSSTKINVDNGQEETSSNHAWRDVAEEPSFIFSVLRLKLREQMNRQRALRNTLSTVVQKSSVTTDDESATNPVDYCLSSRGNRVVRGLVLLLCTGICIFQLVYFLGFYFEFPTSVDVEVVRRRFIDFESVTVCNAKAFRKNLLCETNNSLCWSTERSFTNRDPDILNMVAKDMKKYSIDIKDLLKSCTIHTLYNHTSFTEMCQNNSNWVYDGSSTCWTIAPPIDNQKIEEYLFELIFDFHLEEYGFVEQTTAGWVYFHSRYLVPDIERDISVSIPYLEVSRGFVEQIVVNYLQAPYPPKCKNITTIADDGQRKYEELCYHECLWKYLNETCGCIPETITFVEQYHACNNTQEVKCRKEVDIGILRDTCETSCPVSCRITLYKLTIFRNDYERRKNTENMTIFNLDLRQVYHLEYNHKPQFTPIEVFSYVGGFIGIWLGISIPVAFDRFTFLVAFFHHLRKWNKQS